MRRAMTPCVHTTTKTASVRHDHSICRLCGLYPRNQVSRLAVLPQTPVKTHNQLIQKTLARRRGGIVTSIYLGDGFRAPCSSS